MAGANARAKTKKHLKFFTVKEEGQSKARLLEPLRCDLKGHTMHFGCVIAVVDLIDCLPTEELAKTISEREGIYGNYEQGRFGWLLENARQLEEPLPYRGSQKWGRVDLTGVDFKEAPANEPHS